MSESCSVSPPDTRDSHCTAVMPMGSPMLRDTQYRADRQRTCSSYYVVTLVITLISSS